MNLRAMSTVSYKLSMYLFIMFMPIFFFHTFSTYVSLKTFIVTFLILFICITWQKYIFKNHDSNDGMLNMVKGKKHIASTLLFAICVQFIILKIILNICIFINIFIVNNLWLINFNIHRVMLVMFFIILVIGYITLHSGYKQTARLRIIATLITIIFIFIVVFSSFSTAFVNSLEELKITASFSDSITRATPIFALFSGWLLVTTILHNDEKRKKIGIIFNIVNFLLILFFAIFFFNKLIGHISYGENTLISQFFLLAQTIFYIILFKLYIEKAYKMKIINKANNIKLNSLIMGAIVVTFLMITISQITIEQAYSLGVSIMFLIVIVFHFFTNMSLKKVSHKIINVMVMVFYLFLLFYVINIYIIFVIGLAIICVVYLRNKDIQIIQKVENEFYIYDINGHKLSFNYQNFHLITYQDNLITTTKFNDITKILQEIGIEEYRLVNKNSYELKTKVNEITKRNEYYVYTDLAKPKINIAKLNIKPKDTLVSYFWEHKNIRDFKV